MLKNPPIYGKHSDTGDLSIRAVAGFAKIADGLYDPGTVELRVEVWSARPFGPEQLRAHCMEVYVPSPMTEAKYEDAYKRILGTYEDYWKLAGAIPPSDWRFGLAQACGTAVQALMNSELMKQASSLN